ncbi:sigma factor-like helix-turn-helix DNA-binding protein [Streptomyces sp. NPDC001093]|uniref:sigma factor-like helix-turn-helix DNA-binding protein n=1 Tax=Streptomyces sp. NPDC001093 TaxID=3154376 RepID=UPI00331C44F7
MFFFVRKGARTTRSAARSLPPPRERRRLRRSRSLTRAQVAARVGVSRSTLGAWESGRRVPQDGEGEAYARHLTTYVLQETVERAAAPEASPGPETPPAPLAAAADPLTPAQAFDALYAFCAPALVRQAYLLTGRRELAREAVERAFQLAWQRWPEVARDRDPGGWVRAAAHDCALSPWHRFRPRYRDPEPPPTDPADRALLHALLELPPVYRRTLVLYDGVGLDLPETAAETEASTPAAANRLTHAREALAAGLPELADPAELHRRLLVLASAERLPAAGPEPVRRESERRNVFWTRAAIAFTVAIIGATTLTVRSAPTHYEAPLAPAQAVQGVPPVGAMGPLSRKEQALRAKLQSAAAKGPQRLGPEPR